MSQISSQLFWLVIPAAGDLDISIALGPQCLSALKWFPQHFQSSPQILKNNQGSSVIWAGSLWTLVPFSPFGGVFRSLLLIHHVELTRCPKELQASYLWDHSGVPALALILGGWPEKQLFLRRVVSSLMRLGETKSPYKYRHTGDFHLGDTSSWLWGTHGPLSTLGLPCVGSMHHLSAFHVLIYGTVWFPSPHPRPRAAMVESYFLYFETLPSMAPGWSNLLPAQSSRDLWHSPQRAFQLLACNSCKSFLTDTFTRLQIFMFKPCWWEIGILCANKTTHVCILPGSSLPSPSLWWWSVEGRGTDNIGRNHILGMQ